ncbi:MAG: flagellar basal-body rod protein FlgF [Actinobacteria bacterium]|nr:flagellar basal-body rod protein FlgF [Actinomycetota bacterium]
MINGIYLATSGMNVEQKRMDILSNNLANINSTGFKKKQADFAVFNERLFKNMSVNNVLGIITSGPVTESISVNLSEGPLKMTGNPYDLAINGNNFFVVESGNGELLTRDGCFGLDGENFLVNQDGYHVLGDGGRINITDGGELYVDTAGNIFTGGMIIDKLRVVSVENGRDIQTESSSYFKLKDGAAGANGAGVVIKQGFLETSNVNGIDEMVEIISVMRSYEASQKAIKMQDESLSKVVNETGKVS